MLARSLMLHGKSLPPTLLLLEAQITSPKRRSSSPRNLSTMYCTDRGQLPARDPPTPPASCYKKSKEIILMILYTVFASGHRVPLADSPPSVTKDFKSFEEFNQYASTKFGELLFLQQAYTEFKITCHACHITLKPGGDDWRDHVSAARTADHLAKERLLLAAPKPADPDAVHFVLISATFVECHTPPPKLPTPPPAKSCCVIL
jgi:hypothetical protein